MNSGLDAQASENGVGCLSNVRPRMKIILFWLMTLGLLGVVGAPVAAVALDGAILDWSLLGVLVTVLSWGWLMLWALREIRHDPSISLSERGSFRRVVFHRTRNFGVRPWLYLRDRVHGRGTRSSLGDRAVGSA